MPRAMNSVVPMRVSFLSPVRPIACRDPGRRSIATKRIPPAACAPGMPDAQAIADQNVMLQLLM
jgi:hypothetical protein